MTSLEEYPPAGTVQQASKVLNVNEWTLYQAIKRGEVRVCRIGRLIRVPRSSLLELLGETEK